MLVMKTLLLCTLTVWLGVQSAGAFETASPFLLEPLDKGAWAAIDNPAAKEAGSGSNAGFIIGADAVLVVDTFENTAAAQQLLASIRSKTDRPVRFVVNTHYHFDHVAGNAVFAPAGATILAQNNVSKWERTENTKFFPDFITAQQRDSIANFRLPDVTYLDGATVYLAPERAVQLRAMPGHTGGDTVVYDRDANVVYCGDLFWNHTLPNLIDASTKEWIATLDELVKDYPQATFVAGHGDRNGKAADVLAFRDYLAFLRAAIVRAQASGGGSQAVLQRVLPLVKAKYGDWGFQGFAEPDIQRTDEELRGVKRLPK